MNKIDFYYWADQCPHNSKMKEILERLSNDKEYTVNMFDISNDYNTARKLNIFSPTVTVFNNNIRLHGPISEESIKKIAKNEIIPKPSAYRINIGNNIIEGELRNITDKSIFDTCKLCAPSLENPYCSGKSKWIKDTMIKFNIPHLGKLHYLNNKCVGGAEFVPSIIVPYPIPRADDTAFLTCSFLSSESADYKRFPLQKLEEELPEFGYKTIIAIASEDSCFPNGPLSWFLDRNYMDLGELYYEKMHFARMHLIRKTL